MEYVLEGRLAYHNGGIPSNEQCLPAVEEQLKQINAVQSELKLCLEAAQQSMKAQFNKGVKETPNWNIGEEVWLNSRNILTTRPIPKLDHQWLGPFQISKKISQSAYKLNLPLFMQGVHPVFHVSVLPKNNSDTIAGRRHPSPELVQVNNEEEREVEGVMVCRKRGKKVEYLVSWKGFIPEENLWELVDNLKHCQELVAKFNTKFPDAASRHKGSRRMK
ncbi:uncharacterized protein PGTG_21023 [Puccinia graminis f. sp. tritici CRL 75-36-700-3]|uniref:Chromo domain-containing protein n=1 Tax=Puccinia graminis f. sp. tritici (strain CRL 75-36-700-3 / race SCCL) TaxID=418459 RepID=H6QQ61_PUCGT|nr:uncharacterized protein PGTG_21023 [Puccinia graminis f. sp. tritici CRL 75-36-700-3]EHS64673.1 hypothetical protein PGTG_21023 [Puccinia graminis f. sp. tritici CRL 75-36-700-3]